nr:P1 family peptidase [Planctomycetota bacterium]
ERRRRRIDTSLGKHVLRFDWPAIRIGAAVYPDGPTGCTVFRFPRGATAVADIRGGAPATILTDRLRERSGLIDALCLAGGSVHGLEAATGVAGAILRERKNATAWDRIAIVPGAILYDFGVRKNAVYPDRELGEAALAAVKTGRFPLGARGAGVSASCGKWLIHSTESELAGQGGAFHQSGPTKVAVFTAVNSLGAIVDRKGNVVRGHLDPKTKARVPMPDLRIRDRRAGSQPGGNTTLTVFATNQRLPADTLRQVAREVHTSMARAIDPFHTLNDGDVLFGVTTNEVTNASLNPFQLAALGSECAWDAVLSSFTGRT